MIQEPPIQTPTQPSTQSSPVAYQHLQLYQGGLISQDALETAKAELEDKLAHAQEQISELKMLIAIYEEKLSG